MADMFSQRVKKSVQHGHGALVQLFRRLDAEVANAPQPKKEKSRPKRQKSSRRRLK